MYASPELFALEMRHLFGRTWVYVGHESEIPQPNDFVMRTMGRRPVILARKDDGSLSVLLNRCPHRGALMCRTPRGNARRFTCGYHAWTFENDGRCVGVPLRHAYGEAFQRSDQDMHAAAKVEAYRGFIFASMNAAVPPLIEHLAGARSSWTNGWTATAPAPCWCRTATCSSRPMRTGRRCTTMRAMATTRPSPTPRCCACSPSATATMWTCGITRRISTKSPILSKDLGNGHTLLDQRPAMHAVSAWRRQHVSPGREAAEEALTARYGAEETLRMLDASTGSGLNLNIFPNLLIIGNQIQMLEPVTVNRTIVRWFSTTLEGAPPEVNATRMRLQEDFPSFGEVDDTAQFESCQHGLEDVPEMEWVDIRRHMETGVGYPDTDGLWREPISSDLHLRCYYAAWRQVMEA